MTSSEKNFEEYSKRAKRAAERHDLLSKSEKFAREFWIRLVADVGEPQAKEIMRHVMGDKKPGPRNTDQDVALISFIYANILHWGLDQTDGKIAKRILESKPYYLHYESGAFGIASNELSETYMSLDDDPIVGRKPVTKSLTAIKKQVERIRRQTIEDDLLPKDYSPRPWRRD